jgi:hypothetical protein
MATHAPRRIGGWLGLLILWMVVLRPLAGTILWQQMHASSLADPTAVARGTWLVNTSIFWLVFLTVAALSIYGGLRLWRDRTAGSVWAAIVVLWITTPIAAGAILISQAYLTEDVTLAGAAGRLLANVAIAAAWTLYLLRSRRVRDVYFAAADRSSAFPAGVAVSPPS